MLKYILIAIAVLLVLRILARRGKTPPLREEIQRLDPPGASDVDTADREKDPDRDVQ